MYIPGIDQSQQISAKTGETADKSDQNPEIAGGNHNPKQNRKGKGKGKGEHQDPNAGWKNPMQVYTATPKEKQDTNTINQLRASSKHQNTKMEELNEKLKKYEEKHGKIECKYSSDHSDSETVKLGKCGPPQAPHSLGLY